MSSNWITDAEIARTQRLLALANLSREAGESAVAAIGRMADWMRDEAIAAFGRDHPAWAADGIRLSDALDAGDCPADVAEAYYLRSVPHGPAVMALVSVGGDDLVAAWNAVPTLPDATHRPPRQVDAGDVDGWRCGGATVMKSAASCRAQRQLFAGRLSRQRRPPATNRRAAGPDTD